MSRKKTTFSELRVGLLAMPQQNGLLRRVAENVRQPTGGVLDGLRVYINLLHPAWHQLQQLGEHKLGLGAAHPHRQAQHGLEVEGAPQFREHAVVGFEVLVGERLGELLKQLALGMREVARNHHVDDHAQVAVTTSP